MVALLAAASAAPTPPPLQAGMDYAVTCRLDSRDGGKSTVTGKFVYRNRYVAEASLSVTGQPLPLPQEDRNVSVTDQHDFWIKENRSGMDYTWKFGLSSESGTARGMVSLWAARMTSQFTSTSVGYLATGICDVTASRTRTL
jgi:hypothetical protein